MVNRVYPPCLGMSSVPPLTLGTPPIRFQPLGPSGPKAFTSIFGSSLVYPQYFDSVFFPSSPATPPQVLFFFTFSDVLCGTFFPLRGSPQVHKCFFFYVTVLHGSRVGPSSILTLLPPTDMGPLLFFVFFLLLSASSGLGLLLLLPLCKTHRVFPQWNVFPPFPPAWVPQHWVFFPFAGFCFRFGPGSQLFGGFRFPFDFFKLFPGDRHPLRAGRYTQPFSPPHTRHPPTYGQVKEVFVF